MVKAALDKNLHVFCEKPFVLDPNEGEALARLAAEKGLVNQVGYHYRYVGAFQEVKRLLDAGAIGDVSHVTAEAYGPVVLRSKGGTWRNQRAEGGGCLYDYAAHPLNLLNWYFGQPESVGGTVLNSIFSKETDDEAYGTLFYPNGLSAQLSVNWSDESYRKMSTKMTIWGSKGRIYADRQECQVFLRDTATPPAGYQEGWNVRYTTDLTEPVWFYVRGEEYSAQLDAFVNSIANKTPPSSNTFAAAAATDRVIAMMIQDAQKGGRTRMDGEVSAPAPTQRKRGLLATLTGRS
jgi:predicted dehydrogenase